MLKDIVYSKSVVEFVTVANEFCTFVEQSVSYEKNDFIDRLLKILALLYLKASLLSNTQKVTDEDNKNYVTEFDRTYVQKGIQVLLGDDDFYNDNYDLHLNELPEPATYSISEHLANIYQENKNFLEIYKLGSEILSNEALFDCKTHFDEYWGLLVINVMRMLHYIKFLKPNTENEINTKFASSRNTDEWFITKAQKNFKRSE